MKLSDKKLSSDTSEFRQFTKKSVFIFCVAFHMIIVSVSSLDSRYSECFYAEDKCPNENISFWLYSREAGSDGVELNVLNIQRDLFAQRKPMMVLIHGYTGHKDFAPNTHIRPALLKSRDMLVLSLDYNPVAREPCYVEATYNIKTVARCTAQLLDSMIEKDMISLNELHIVGFSLGSHVAGMIANFLKSGKIKRISGLDPANPLFKFTGSENRLDVTDAEFVDVIHTDVTERGLLFQVGHLDFYPNSGFDQPGCRVQNFTSSGSCNHDRAPAYYAESISSEIGFWGYACANWFYNLIGLCRWTDSRKIALMGYHASPSEKGIYFLETNMQPPYAKGPYPHVPNSF